MILDNIILFIFILTNGIQFLLKVNSYFTNELLGIQHLHGFPKSDAFNQVEKSAVFEFEDLWQGHERNEVVPEFSPVEVDGDLLQFTLGRPNQLACTQRKIGGSSASETRFRRIPPTYA